MHEMARELKGELDAKLSGLQALVLIARQESQRLEAAVAKAGSLEIAPPRDTLARIEGLADPAALASQAALADLAAQMPGMPRGIADDFFEADKKPLAIARLADRGYSPAEIADELGLPIGEVELLLSLRTS
jgi:hypothetical protein